MKIRGGAWACVLAGLACQAVGVEPLREGESAHRAQTKDLELKPFSSSLWDKLGDWQGGGALTSAETKDKVVLVLFYSEFIPTSRSALTLARSLAESKGEKGLLVVAAHSARGWELAKKEGYGGAIRLAHDAKGDLRSALLSDGDPDFYVIDRAGQMRFADITTDSVAGAVDTLLGESVEAAAGTNARLAAAAQKASEEARRTRPVNEAVDMAAIPELPFVVPTEKEYTDAKWPRRPRDPQKQDEIAYLEPNTMSWPEADWFPKKPSLKGRVAVVYFFHPKIPLTYQDLIPAVERLQKQHGRDVLFVGAGTPLDSINEFKMLKEDKDPENIKKMLEKFASAQRLAHPFVLDGDSGMFNAVKRDVSPVPFPVVAVVSSDGLIRWWSPQGTVAFEAALQQTIEADPGVKARRKVEADYIARLKQ